MARNLSLPAKDRVNYNLLALRQHAHVVEMLRYSGTTWIDYLRRAGGSGGEVG